jgi:hypothetical protein
MGTRCVSEVAPDSPSLCKRHQNRLQAGDRVVNFETRRAFPKPKPKHRRAKKSGT